MEGFVLQASRVRLFLVFWLFVLSAVGFLDRTNISIAGVEIAKEFAIDKIHLGWIFSAFLLGYAGFQIPAGWLAVRYGPRMVLTWGLVWWALFTILTAAVAPAMAHSLSVLIAIRFILGVGESVMYPAGNQMLAYWIPVSERGRANGWIFAGVGAGTGLTPPLLTAIIINYGWRASFWFCAVLGLVAGAVWYFCARDKPEEHPGVSPGELALINAGLPARQTGPAPDVPWKKIFTSANTWFLTLAYFTFGYVAWIYLSWFYIYLVDVRGVDLKQSAILSTLPFIAMTVCCLGGGVINDRVSKAKSPYWGRCVTAAVGLFGAALFLVLGSSAENAVAAATILACGAGALYLSQSSFWAVSADVGGPHAGVVSGVMNTGCQLAGALTASLTPWIAQSFGWTAAFFVAAALACVGALSWLLVDPGRPMERTPA
jgi:ACS family glucarate transporter-like MFS transporter